MLYSVDIFEVIVKNVVVEAETEEAAKEEAKRRYFDGEPIEADDPVFDGTQIDVEATKLLNKQEV